MNVYDKYLLEQLQLAETKEERVEIITEILKRRPDIKELMVRLIFMERSKQDEAVGVLNEAMKPHTVSM